MKAQAALLVPLLLFSSAHGAEPSAPPPNLTLADFLLPTANDNLFREGREADFFQATAAGEWQSGQFGCVRTNGTQFHEGIDIRCLQRDRQGEPVDAVNAVAAGTLAYSNPHAGKSNYGRYLVVQHHLGGMELYSLYAHLSAITDGLTIGAPVARGQRLGTLGHTGAGLTRDRAHLHLEFDFLANPNFVAYFQKTFPKEPNDHGVYNGQNLFGLDPAALFRAARQFPQLTLADFVQTRTEAFRVLLPPQHFRWLERNAWMLEKQPSAVSGQLSAQNIPAAAPHAPPSGYEVSLDGTGLPRHVIARTDPELTEAQQQAMARGHFVLLSVNETELARGNCRHLIHQSKNGWQLTEKGLEWMNLLTY